ncbi:hypothetical protein B0T20DRAFT_248069 [Sordaria brevicollis]|uniref:Secreted protein n=1 Tax=Sordaria brevicollis TaxID=83679 RepID=A0AAE0PC19_SORBR|nr:hypothetical protein B0T20DRAFT_248069 [Sordaria brevicollis]
MWSYINYALLSWFMHPFGPWSSCPSCLTVCVQLDMPRCLSRVIIPNDYRAKPTSNVKLRLCNAISPIFIVTISWPSGRGKGGN